VGSSPPPLLLFGFSDQQFEVVGFGVKLSELLREVSLSNQPAHTQTNGGRSCCVEAGEVGPGRGDLFGLGCRGDVPSL